MKNRYIRNVRSLAKTPVGKLLTVKMNPLKVDPTRTSALRRKVGAELRRRYMRLRKSLLTMIRDRDVLGLKPPDYMTRNNDWKYETSSGKVKRFRAWLRQQMDSTLAGDALIEQWIQESHGRGAGRAFDELRIGTPNTLTDRSGIPLDYQRNEALRRVKTHKATVEKVKLLAGRTFTELDGINAQMSSKMSRLLAEGLVRGWSPTKIANQMSRVVSLSLKQALAITRSELIRAHAEGTLDGMVDQGETRVTAQVEFVTADDERVCSKCRSLEGRIYRIEDARGVIPMHPLCRCTWLPISKRNQRKLVGNAFCPTGTGGGVNPHCSPHAAGHIENEVINEDVPDQARPHLTKDQSEAIRWYTEQHFYPLNKALRRGTPLDDEQTTNHEHLTAAMAKVKDFPPVTVYRGMSLAKTSDLNQFIANAEQTMKDKGTIRFGGYLSTSTNLKQAQHFGGGQVLFEIQAKRGLDVEPHAIDPGEKELLLPHGSEFWISHVEKRGDYEYTVRMVQV